LICKNCELYRICKELNSRGFMDPKKICPYDPDKDLNSEQISAAIDMVKYYFGGLIS